MLCESVPLVAVTVTTKVPVDVPVATLKSTGFDTPALGAGFSTTTGNVPVVAKSAGVKAIELRDALVNVTG